MSKWELLKESLTKGRSSSNAASIHAFAGHHLLSKEKVIWRGYKINFEFKDENSYRRLIEHVVSSFQNFDCCEIELEIVDYSHTLDIARLQEEIAFKTDINVVTFHKMANLGPPKHTFISMLIRSSEYLPVYSTCCFNRYSLPSGKSIFAREIPEKRKMKANDILSDILYGVDNTGNICTWPSESILLYLLVCVPWLRNMVLSKSILEIGGGQTALAGLGLAVEEISHDIIVSDGHPNCVINQGVCIECNKQRGNISSSCNIRSIQLEWSNFSNFPFQSVDVVIGSDCLFFKDFHDSLVTMLNHILSPDGVVILLQPPRSGTLNVFASKAEEYFSIQRFHDYLPEISEQRDTFLRDQKEHYNLDKHYPILLVMHRK